MRFELTTSSLPRKRSTPELSRRDVKKKSQAVVGCDFHWAEDEGRTRDIQLGRLTLYQLSYFRVLFPKTVGKRFANLKNKFRSTCQKNKKCGEGRIRTYEVVRQQSYSLIHLATLEPPQFLFLYMSLQRDSNPRPADYKSAALASWATEAKILKNYLSLFASANISEFFWNLQIILKNFCYFI